MLESPSCLVGTTHFPFFVLGVMVLHRFALVHTRVKYARSEVLVWLTLHGKHFVACKIATTYREDLSLQEGVVPYVQVFLYE